MDKELNCNQVSALLNFYIEGKLNQKLMGYIDLHLAKCPKCAAKVKELKKIYNNFKNSKNLTIKKEENKFNAEFLNNLSAYVDNELNPKENIKIKKITITNPNARKELENMYKYKKLMKQAYEKTKNDSKYDYSKNIISKIQDFPDYSTTYFYKLSAVFLFLIISITICFIYLYF